MLDGHHFVFVSLLFRIGTVYAFGFGFYCGHAGTLKRNLITFSPGLPDKLDHAIKHMGCDVSDKVVMHFPPNSSHTWGGSKRDVFYHIAEETDGHVGGHHGEFTENWNINHYNKREMIMSFSVGVRDWAELEGVNDTDAVVQAEALTALRTAYPNLPNPIKTHLQRWGDDQYASCTWSSWFLGSSPKDTKEFLKGTDGGRILFAGEHATKVHPGTTHGAWATGLSAASTVSVNEARLAHGLGLLSPDAAADLREKEHTPNPADVMEVPFMRSKRKQWGRMQKAKAAAAAAAAKN